ncbi:MAG: hypothetical protein HY965_06760 [Ignavibacteriales bacterium]|nr:hypothetical protein [Ignavibacteriales bacterium]
MKKMLFLVFLTGFSIAFAQRANSLFQVMHNGSLLAQPEFVREMQYKIASEMDAQGYGLDAGAVTKLFTKWKEMIDKELNGVVINFKIEGTEPKKLLMLETIFLKETLKVTLNPIIVNELTFNEFRVTMRQVIVSRLDAFLNKSAGYFLADEKVKESFFYMLASSFASVSGNEKTELKKEKPYSLLLANQIADLICKPVIDSIALKISSDFHCLICTDTSSVKLIDFINTLIAQKLKELRTEVLRKLEISEYKMNTAFTDISNKLINAHTGLAVSSSDGNLAGGVQFLYKWESNLQFGVYLNGQMSVNDDVKPDSAAKLTAARQDTTDKKNRSISLVGVQFRYALSNWQFDLLASKLVGDKKSRYWEFGLGIGYHLSKGLITTLNYYGNYQELKPDNKSASHLVGFSFQGVSSDSPVVLLGMVAQKGVSPEPVIQIGYPISIKK